jgi:hypothetical protein
MVNGICTFVLPKGSKKVTTDDVRRLAEEEDLEFIGKFT